MPELFEHMWFCGLRNARAMFGYIMESVDSICMDGPDIYICVIHYKKKKNNSEQVNCEDF